jgi:hypothetical protein
LLREAPTPPRVRTPRTYCSIQATYAICVVKYANGQGCGSTNMDVDEHCASGFCENNVCCNMRCAGSCTGRTCLSGSP